jgi:hypothetical protein
MVEDDAFDPLKNANDHNPMLYREVPKDLSARQDSHENALRILQESPSYRRDTRRNKAHTRYGTEEREFPSVTEIVGTRSKPALVPWSHKLGKDGLDWWGVQRDAQNIGTATHMMIAGETPTTADYSSDILHASAESYSNYDLWYRSHDVEVLAQEKSVTCRYGFGGTLDMYAKVDGRLTIVDFKTGKGIYPEHTEQLVGYSILLDSLGLKVESCQIVRIGHSPKEYTAGKRKGKVLDGHGGLEVRDITVTHSHVTAFLSLLQSYNDYVVAYGRKPGI